MAKSILEYWNGSAWVQAKTVNAATNAADQQNALIRVEITDKLNNPRTANIDVVNAGREPFGSGANRYGPLNAVFTDFMTVRIIEDDSKVILFQGKLYDVKKDYDLQRGSVLRLYARDNLAELADYPTDDKDEPISSTDGARTSAKRSDIIKTIIRDSASDPHMASLMISTANIVTDDTQKFEASDRTFSHDGVTEDFILSSQGRQGLNAIAKIASNDGHGTGEVDEFGFDYYVDTQQALGASNPAMDFNYFKRGTKTNYQATPGNFDGLTVEYPLSKDRTFETGSKTMMMQGFDFQESKADLYTGAVMHISRELEGEDGETISVNRALEMEILEGNVSSEFLHAKDNSGTAWKQKSFTRIDNTAKNPEDFADYLWKLGDEVATGALINDGDNITTGDTEIVVDGTQDPLIKAGEVIMIDTENMYVTAATTTLLTVIRAWGTGHSSYSVAATHNNNAPILRHNIVGRLQYQSVTSGEGFILISFEKDVVSSKIINTQRKNFEAIATATSDITLTNGNDHFVFDPSTERVANLWGIKKLLRVTRSESKTVDSLRKNIAHALKSSKTKRTNCNIGTYRPPFIYHETYALSAPSSIQIVLADSEDDRNAFDIGLRNGMAIAKVATGAVHSTQTDYGYVTSILDTDTNTATVTAPIVATADESGGTWTGYTGSGNKLRFYIPVRAGHYIYAKNPLVNFEGYMFVQEIVYTEEAGIQSTFYKGTAVNEAGTNTTGSANFASGLHTLVAGATANLNTSNNPPLGGLGFKFRPVPSSTTETAKFTRTDRDTISWTGGELTVGQMMQFSIIAGNTGAMDTTADSVTTYPPVYVIYFDIDQVPNDNGQYVLSSIVESAYKADMNHVLIGHARANKNTAGKAYFIREGSGMGFFGGNDGIGEDSFSPALFKKSVQPYTTNIAIYPGKHTSSTVYSTGTALQAGSTTITGDGTTWIAGMIGEEFRFTSGGGGGIITGRASNTSITVAASATVSSGTYLITTTATPDNLQRYIHATSGAKGTAVNGTISFASGDTIPLNFNNGTTDTAIAPSLDLGAVNSVVYYVYYFLADSGDDETSDFTEVTQAIIDVTTDYTLATSESRGLLAICSTGSTASADEIAIQAFHGKGQNINADVIAANAITATAIKAGTITTRLDGSGTSDMPGVTLNTAGQIMAGKTSYGSGTGYILEYNSGTPRFDIGDADSYFRWDGTNVLVGGTSKIDIGGVGADGTGGVGQMLLRSPDGNATLRTRAFDAFMQFDVLSKGMYFVVGGLGDDVTVDGTPWSDPEGFIAPYANGRTILGSIKDYGSSPNEYGIGWRALVLGARDTDITSNAAANNAAIVLRAHTSTVNQYVFTFPATVPGSNGYQLASTTGGVITWAAASSSLRYKENIRPLEIDSTKIYNLEPKSFTLKEGHVSTLGNATFGYIAEEVDKVLPEVVRYDKENRPDSLNYQLLTVFLIAEVKKLRTRVDNLEAG